jgi:hypothetical protein
VLGLLEVPCRRGKAVASDLYVRGNLRAPISTKYEELEAFLRQNRVIRWEEELTSLLDSGAVTATGVKKSTRDHKVSEFLSRRRNVKRT